MLALLLIHRMATLIIDACSLIYITKIGLKEKLPKLGKWIIGSSVELELLSDIEKFPDAKTIQKNLKKGIITTEKFQSELIHIQNLGKGEIETILIGKSNNYEIVTDDTNAVKFAISQGFRPKTSEIILLDLLDQNVLNLKQFNLKIDELATIKSLKTEIVDFFKSKALEFQNEK